MAGEQRLPWVLMYHSVADYTDAPPGDPYRVTVRPATFEAQMRWLRRAGLRGVSVGELLAARSTRGLVGLTFDDGYADFATTVVPVLQRFGFTATTYVLGGCFGGWNAWDTPGPRKALLTAEQVRAVADAGFEVGSHGLAHRSLPTLSDAELADDLGRSREVIAAVTGRAVGGFAYPYGHLGEREVRAVRDAGYDHACAIWPGATSGRHALVRAFAGERDGALRLLAKRVQHTARTAGPARARTAGVAVRGAS